jgi:cobalt-zinc-cadmium efflux system outer membrane protein
LAAGRAGIEGAVERHPSVALARAAAARATSQLDLEDARGRPDLLVTGGYKRTVHRSTGVAGVGLALPLFDRNGPARARAAADLNAARFTLEATRTRVRAELTAQVEAARALSAESGPLDASLASAAVARQAARARFAEGRSDVLGLVDAERLWLDTTRDLIAIRTDALLAALHALLGLDDPFTP